MGKVYQFPASRRLNTYKPPNKYSPDHSMLCDLMDTLVLTYEDRIKELEGYIQEIKSMDDLRLKGAREVLKQVKELQKLFLKYGLSCNFFKFYTSPELEVRYYNESESMYLINEGDLNAAKKLTIEEFMTHFKDYFFSLRIETAVLEIFEKQINQLEITITTIKNTEV